MNDDRETPPMTDLIRREDEKFEFVTRRVEWVFMIGTIGDSEGKTWAKELIEEKRFPTHAAATAYRDHHPDLELSSWGAWKTKNCYGQFAIVKNEVVVPDPRDAVIARLVEAVGALGAMPEGYCFCSAHRIGDDSKVHEPECRDLRATLAAAKEVMK